MRKVLEGFDFKFPSYTFTEKDFADMAAALGLGSLPQKYRDALQSECFSFLALVASWKNAPRPGAIRKHLEKVQSGAVRLMKTLHALHDAGVSDRAARQASMTLLHGAAPDNDWAEIDFDLMKLSGRLANVAKAAKKVIACLPEGRGGPPGDLPLDVLVPRIGAIFCDITGKRPTVTTDPYAATDDEFKGQFLDFLKAFLMPLDPYYPRKGHALGVAVKRILSRP
jgi:hypothetical protein